MKAGLYTVCCLFLLSAVLAARALGLCIMAAPQPEFSPAALTVTKLADTNDDSCDADCSLRGAIAAAAPDNTCIAV